MAGGGGVSVARYPFAPTAAETFHDHHVVTPHPRPVKSPLVWNSRTVPLGDVLRSHSTPIVIRDGGTHDDLLCRDLYVHSVSPCNVVLAEGLAADRRYGLVSTGRRYFIPVDHRGWFELLSQDGHAASPISTVHQLMKLAPERCLVRRTVVGILEDDAGRWACKISAGETLSIDGVVSSSSSRSQCLRCRVDSTGQRVLLAVDQRGLFSPIAGPTTVVGVHRMRSVASKFRLPVIVRLIARNSPAAESSSSSNNSGSTTPTVAFRVNAIQTEPAAYVVPLWLIKSPSDASRRSLLLLPTSSQTSSVLDGVRSTTEVTNAASENWTESDWDELRRRCDELIKAHAISAEMTRLFPSQSVDDHHRTLPVTSVPPSQPPQSAGGSDEWRLLREIDDIYEAIKARDVTAGRKNGVRTTTTTTTTRQIPRRYRSVRQDSADKATFNSGGVVMRSPARRSHTLDPYYNKAPHYHNHHHHHTVDYVQSQQQQLHNGRPRSPSPSRLRRVSSHMTPTTARRHSPSPQLQQLQLQHDEQLQQHINEPVYEELRTPPGNVTDSLESGQYVLLTDSPPDNLRDVIKRKSSTPSHRSRPVERSRRWSVAVGSEHSNSVIASQLQVFDDLPPPTDNDDVAVPVTQRLDDVGKTVPGGGGHTDTVSSGRLTSSSSDDVIPTSDRKSTSALAAMSSTLRRALRRKADTTLTAASESPRVGSQARYQPTDHGHVADHASCDVTALEYAGGKVTHF